ncbi:hypothetical protein [uncultured Paraglaciecola sp.]|uniref:hypothetical protein n=1 Tax=uncultured Paraglaciecola sp. TaxID=1765024 RepID=UPI00262B94A0|nr:hypothetical protein [uncultured Paraglaciecola sp.]
MEPITFIIGACLGRFRGGALNETIRNYLGFPNGWELENNYARLPWAIAVYFVLLSQIQFGLFPRDHVVVPLLMLAAAMGGVIPSYWGGKFNLALKENRNPRNYAWLTLRGMFIAFPAAVIAAAYDVPNGFYGVVAGALFVPAYLTGYWIHSKYNKWMAGSQYGEALLYGSILMAIGV